MTSQVNCGTAFQTVQLYWHILCVIWWAQKLRIWLKKPLMYIVDGLIISPITWIINESKVPFQGMGKIYFLKGFSVRCIIILRCNLLLKCSEYEEVALVRQACHSGSPSLIAVPDLILFLSIPFWKWWNIIDKYISLWFAQSPVDLEDGRPVVSVALPFNLCHMERSNWGIQSFAFQVTLFCSADWCHHLLHHHACRSRYCCTWFMSKDGV